MKKTGFSLIEVLMVMGIIGVVTAMGISISQKGIEKAYRNYWYTAYKALSEATLDAGINDELDNPTNYQNHIKTLLKLNDDGVAPNGVVFTFNGYVIDVTIPSPNTKKIVQSKSRFVYDENSDVLYPANVNAPMLNLQNRVDILPFIINESSPNNNQSGSSNSNTVKKVYSYIEAYCMTHENQSISGSNSLTCSSGESTVSGVMQLVDPKKIY